MCCSTRHGDAYHEISAETYPRDLDRYCRCLGFGKGTTENPAEEGKCCGAASGEDGLCDRCRETCTPAVTKMESSILVTEPVSALT